jgi:hypothetical protein
MQSWLRAAGYSFVSGERGAALGLLCRLIKRWVSRGRPMRAPDKRGVKKSPAKRGRKSLCGVSVPMAGRCCRCKLRAAIAFACVGDRCLARHDFRNDVRRGVPFVPLAWGKPLAFAFASAFEKGKEGEAGALGAADWRETARSRAPLHQPLSQQPASSGSAAAAAAAAARARGTGAARVVSALVRAAALTGRAQSIRGYSLCRKIFTPFDFYWSHLTIRLIQKICENTKTIMIYLLRTLSVPFYLHV